MSLQYPGPLCESFTWGRNPVEKEVVFAQEIPVYQNLLGETSYGLYNTRDSKMYIGGDYKESIYFPMAITTKPEKMTLAVNPDTKVIMAFDLGRLMIPDNRTMNYD